MRNSMRFAYCSPKKIFVEIIFVKRSQAQNPFFIPPTIIYHVTNLLSKVVLPGIEDGNQSGVDGDLLRQCRHTAHNHNVHVRFMFAWGLQCSLRPSAI